MKKIFFGLVATVFLGVFSVNAQEKITISSTVSSEEFKSADIDIQRMSKLIDASVGSLRLFSLNQENKTHSSTIIFSLNENSKDSNLLILGPTEGGIAVQGGSCKACGVSSGMGCYKKIKAYMLAHDMDSINLHVSIGDDGCATITW